MDINKRGTRSSSASPRKKQRISEIDSKLIKPSQDIANFFRSARGQPPEPVAVQTDDPINGLPSPDLDHDVLSDEALARKLQQQEEDQIDADERLARQLQEQFDDPGSNGEQPGSDEEHREPFSGRPTTPPAKDNQPISSAGFFTSSDPATPQKNKVMQLTDEDQSKIFDLPLGSPDFDPLAYADVAKSWTDKSVPYSLLAHTFTLTNTTKSRLLIIDYIANMLRMLVVYAPGSLLDAVWLTTNAIAPPYENIELGLGGSIISKAIKATSGISSRDLKKLYDKWGDAGDTCFEAKTKVRTLAKPAALTIRGVYKTLVEISQQKGTGSGDKKQKLVEKLLLSARGEEARYVGRTLVQHLRIGAVKTTMLIALAKAFTVNKPAASDAELVTLTGLDKQERTDVFKRAEQIVKNYFARKPNYNLLVPALLKGGVAELLNGDEIEVGTPLRPMLGLITRDLDDMFSRLGGQHFTCEFKYDGQRAQIHCDDDGNVTIFSRHLEKMTDKYPDLCALIPLIRAKGVKSFVMEGEVVAWDKLTGMRNFQSLASRARKNVEVGTVKQQVCLFAFDLMYLDGESLLSKSLAHRRALLRTRFVEVDDRFTFVRSIDHPDEADQDEIRAFYKEATDAKCEGIMVKLLEDEIEIPQQAPANEEPSDDAVEPTKQRGSRKKQLLATYTPDQRIESWLKVKKDYDAGADSLDLVPIGAWHGQGRKASWWSPILLACRDAETGTLQAVCKCISGFTDQFYKDMKVKYADHADTTFFGQPPANYDSALAPDIWFHPLEVWEVRMADITLSPVYTAAIGLVSEDRGMSIRFPRFMKLREDKSVEECSTSEELAHMYRKQEADPKRKTDNAQLDVED
ncbi:hypothetical protein PYCC9005_001618 [Savitreella phatthalungensis]